MTFAAELKNNNILQLFLYAARLLHRKCIYVPSSPPPLPCAPFLGPFSLSLSPVSLHLRDLLALCSMSIDISNCATNYIFILGFILGFIFDAFSSLHWLCTVGLGRWWNLSEENLTREHLFWPMGKPHWYLFWILCNVDRAFQNIGLKPFIISCYSDRPSVLHFKRSQ